VTRDHQVRGSTLTHCAVENGPGQAADAHVPPLPSSTIQYQSILGGKQAIGVPRIWQ